MFTKDYDESTGLHRILSEGIVFDVFSDKHECEEALERLVECEHKELFRPDLMDLGDRIQITLACEGCGAEADITIQKDQLEWIQ